jgi:hypothetical protein
VVLEKDIHPQRVEAKLPINNAAAARIYAERYPLRGHQNLMTLIFFGTLSQKKMSYAAQCDKPWLTTKSQELMWKMFCAP